MTLVLRIEGRYEGNSATMSRDGWVHADDSLSIGRAAENGLVLEDPSSTISKRHCVVERSEHGFSIVDQSRNGTFLNGAHEPISRETQTLLSVGDVLRIGPFELHVVSIDDQTCSRAGLHPPLGATPTSGLEEAALLGPVVPRASTDALLAKFDPRYRYDRVEERLVIEAENYESVCTTRSDPVARHSGRFLAADPSVQPRHSGAVADAAPELQMAFVQPKLRIEPIPEDWDLMEEIGQSRSPLAVPIQTSPPEDIPVSSGTSPAAAPRARVDAPRADDAINAFAEACGLTAEDLRDGDLVLVMRRAGLMLRASVENLQALLEARFTTTYAPASERTTIGRSGNNPLKFIPDSHDALLAMLLANIPGFLAADSAVSQAFGDLKAHHEALTGAPRAAVLELCEKLAPDSIEAKAARPRTLGGWMRARFTSEEANTQLWRCYRSTFGGAMAEFDERHPRPGGLLAVGRRSGSRDGGTDDVGADSRHAVETGPVYSGTTAVRC